jgi:hypothetical protein
MKVIMVQDEESFDDMVGMIPMVSNFVRETYMAFGNPVPNEVDVLVVQPNVAIVASVDSRDKLSIDLYQGDVA